MVFNGNMQIKEMIKIPYHSSKQRKYFHANIDKIGKKVVEEFDKAERKKKKRKKKK